MKKQLVFLPFLLLSASCGAVSSSQQSPSLEVSSPSPEEGSSVITEESAESIASISQTSEESSSSSMQSTEARTSSNGVSSIVESSEEPSLPTQSSKAESSEENVSSSEGPAEVKPDPFGDPYLGEQYYLNHIGDIYSAWSQYRGKGITIAVIDAGFDPNHEDFKYADGSSKVSSLSASFETNGANTLVKTGADKVENLGDSHGSFCAGVAAAAINGKGVVGIAPEAELMLLKTDLKPRSIEKAFRYAADNGAKVVTISIGSYYDYRGDLVDDGSDLGTVFDNALLYCRNKGTVVISAAGNGGLDNEPTEFTFPGCCDYVIGAAGLAANSSTDIWGGSSYNSSEEYRFCDVFAPADDMFGVCHYGGKKYDGGWQGTSFASPIVAGMAALYFEKNPSKTPADFENSLYSSCHKLPASGNVRADQLGYGRVDIGALLGISSTGETNVKLRANWNEGYCYAWNSVTGEAQTSWPGVRMEKSGNAYSVKIDNGRYDSLVFAESRDGRKSADLLISSFASSVTYDMTYSNYDRGYGVGRYGAN